MRSNWVQVILCGVLEEQRQVATIEIALDGLGFNPGIGRELANAHRRKERLVLTSHSRNVDDEAIEMISGMLRACGIAHVIQRQDDDEDPIFSLGWKPPMDEPLRARVDPSGEPVIRVADLKRLLEVPSATIVVNRLAGKIASTEIACGVSGDFPKAIRLERKLAEELFRLDEPTFL